MRFSDPQPRPCPWKTIPQPSNRQILNSNKPTPHPRSHPAAKRQIRVPSDLRNTRIFFIDGCAEEGGGWGVWGLVSCHRSVRSVCSVRRFGWLRGPGASRFGFFLGLDYFVGFCDAAYASSAAVAAGVAIAVALPSSPFMAKDNLLIIGPFPIPDAGEGVRGDEGAVSAAHQDARMEGIGREREWGGGGAGEGDAAVEGAEGEEAREVVLFGGEHGEG